MVSFSCNTCGKDYEVTISERVMSYLDGNKRIRLTDDGQDCQRCQDKILEAIKEKKKQIKSQTTMFETKLS